MKTTRFDILTLFPELFSDFLRVGLLGRAVREHQVAVELLDLREFADSSRRMIDDHPYGGGDSMVMAPEPLSRAFDSLEPGRLGRPRIYLTPDGAPFTAKRARALAETGAILLCGRYGGVDQRLRDLYIDEEISVGDFVLMGGEIPAMALVEASARFVPGVLGNEVSCEMESFENGLLEGPQYTRPRVFRGLEVPEVLVSGDHQAIADWRAQKAQQKTVSRRPDLLSDVAGK